MKLWVLFDKDDQVVIPGAQLTTFRGEPCVLEGGRPPQHDGSTGRIFTDLGEFFPSVCGLKWARV